jgi:hypothetical protein
MTLTFGWETRRIRAGFSVRDLIELLDSGCDRNAPLNSPCPPYKYKWGAGGISAPLQVLPIRGMINFPGGQHSQMLMVFCIDLDSLQRWGLKKIKKRLKN